MMKPMNTLPNLIEANLLRTPALKKYYIIVNTKIRLRARALGFTLKRRRNALVAKC